MRCIAQIRLLGAVKSKGDIMILKISKAKAEQIIEKLRKTSDVMIMDNPDVYISTPISEIKTKNVQLVYDNIFHRIFVYAEDYKLNPDAKICNDKETLIESVQNGYFVFEKEEVNST